MLDSNDIQCIVVLRIFEAVDSCNSYHINHTEGQVRALCAVLNNGVPPEATGDIRSYLRSAQIPFNETIEGGWDIPNKWLLEKGFTLKDGERVSHPKFGKW